MPKLSDKSVATPTTSDHIAGIDAADDGVDLYLVSTFLALYDALTATFTNKTFDANASGNSLSNVDLTADVINDLPVAEGGTGVSTLTDGGVLLGSGAGAITPMAVLADGEMIVGDGTTDPVRAFKSLGTQIPSAGMSATAMVTFPS